MLSKWSKTNCVEYRSLSHKWWHLVVLSQLENTTCSFEFTKNTCQDVKRKTLSASKVIVATVALSTSLCITYMDWIFTDFVSTYLEEKYMCIILVPNCTCMPCFSLCCFVFSAQSHGEKLHCKWRIANSSFDVSTM